MPPVYGSEVYGTDVYIRGLIEIGNICRNDCHVLRHPALQPACDRYRLTEDADTRLLHGRVMRSASAPLSCRAARTAHSAVDVDLPIWYDRSQRKFPDCAVTLSLGEFPREDYRGDVRRRRGPLSAAARDRRHGRTMKSCIRRRCRSNNRMRCLRDLKDIGFQTGCGFMVGSPFQTPRDAR